MAPPPSRGHPVSAAASRSVALSVKSGARKKAPKRSRAPRNAKVPQLKKKQVSYDDRVDLLVRIVNFVNPG